MSKKKTISEDLSLPVRSEFLLYQTEDGQTRIEVRLQDETVWLTQKLMADLFQITVPTINEHIKKIFDERELISDATIRKFRIVQKEGQRNVTRTVDYYNLDMIISVGYRVKSHVATRFRIWATQHLREYIIKGFVLDDERLKAVVNIGSDYFDEMLERIRDIRSSETGCVSAVQRARYLANAGKVSKAVADQLALEQYEIFHQQRLVDEARQESLADDAELKRYLESKK
jgi:hypothetical protein